VVENDETFMFDGKTIIFNCEQVEKQPAKLYVEPELQLAGKKTFCKLLLVLNALVKSIATAVVGKELNFTHSN
jgi:hypothetical protein